MPAKKSVRKKTPRRFMTMTFKGYDTDDMLKGLNSEITANYNIAAMSHADLGTKKFVVLLERK